MRNRGVIGGRANRGRPKPRTGGRFVAAIVVAMLATALVAGPARATPAAEQADSDGPFAVGRRDVTVVDSTRPTAANGSYGGAPTRTLPIMILYPADADPSGAGVLTDAPAVSGRRFPLLVFSHGFTATGPAYVSLLRLWAAAGYVVAAPTFPLSSAGAPGGMTIRDYVNQPGDVSFVIDEMLERNRTEGDPLYRHIARRHIAAGGHSLGAITTFGVAYNSCCQDRRIDAAIPFSGITLPFPDGAFFTDLAYPAAPLLLVHGDQDRVVPYAGSARAYAQASAPKYLETPLGGPHTPFRPPWLGPIVASVTDFLDRYLKREPGAGAALDRDAQVEGVTVLEAQPR